MRCWELIEAGHWPLWTNQRPGSMMTDQLEARSDDEDAFWWRVNIGAICYWAAHWLAVVSLLHLRSWPLIGQYRSRDTNTGLWLAAAVLQTQTNGPCMSCMLQFTRWLQHINKYTETLMSDGHGAFVQNWGFNAGHVRASGHWMTSVSTQMQWLDLKWRLLLF